MTVSTSGQDGLDPCVHEAWPRRQTKLGPWLPIFQSGFELQPGLVEDANGRGVVGMAGRPDPKDLGLRKGPLDHATDDFAGKPATPERFAEDVAEIGLRRVEAQFDHANKFSGRLQDDGPGKGVARGPALFASFGNAVDGRGRGTWPDHVSGRPWTVGITVEDRR